MVDANVLEALFIQFHEHKTITILLLFRMEFPVCSAYAYAIHERIMSALESCSITKTTSTTHT